MISCLIGIAILSFSMFIIIILKINSLLGDVNPKEWSLIFGQRYDYGFAVNGNPINYLRLVFNTKVHLGIKMRIMLVSSFFFLMIFLSLLLICIFVPT